MEIIKSFYKKENTGFDKKAFDNPPAEFAVAYGWVWNDKLEKKEIVNQLQEMRRLGIKTVYIIPEPKHFRPTMMPTDLEPEYLSEKYMKFYRFAFEKAEEYGITTWLYDEGGWPSGGACGKVLRQNPLLVRQGLESTTVFYQSGNTYVQPPDVLIAFKNQTEKIQTGYLFTEDTAVDEYYVQTYFEGKADYPNLLLAESTDAFIGCTHEAYKPYLKDKFGKQIPMVFTDEPKGPSKYPYHKDLIDAFEEKYGYSVLPYLPILMEKIQATDEQKQIFIDYYELCSEWFCKNYLLKTRDWCNQNDMCFTGHLADEDQVFGAYNFGCHYATLRALRCLDVPGIDVIWRQIWKDPHRRTAGYAFFPRLASSAAAQNGAGLSISESFAVYGPGLMYEDMRFVLGAQAIRGINIFNFIPISYGRHDFYMAGELPSFSETSYPDLMTFNKYVERLGYVSSLGKADNTVALYMPAREIHIAPLRESIAKDFKKCGDELESSGTPFDILDEDFLENVDENALKNGKLCLGLAEYTKVVIPECEMYSQEIVKILKTFIAGGGTVYTTSAQVQEKIEGAVLKDSCKDLFVFDERVKIDEGILCQRRICPNGTLLLFYNSTKEKKSVSVKASSENAYLLDVTGGNIYDMPKTNVLLSGETVGIFLTKESIETKERIETEREEELKNFTFRKTKRVSIGQKTFEVKEIRETAKQIELGDWQEKIGKEFSGSGVYETTFEYDGKGKVVLDLGEVRSACEAFLNGRSLGVKIMPPYAYEIDSALLKEKNELRVRVTNSLANAYLYNGAFKNMEKWKLSPYFDRELNFAVDSLVGGLFGPVKLLRKE